MGSSILPRNKVNVLKRLTRDIIKNKAIYLIALPGIMYYIIYYYWPMLGVTIAFKSFVASKGVFGSPWIGLEHFVNFFKSYYFTRILRNTLVISFYSIVIGFPAPIILALLLNEVRNQVFKRVVQTVTYMPHFISVVVVSGMIIAFTQKQGLFNDVLSVLGVPRENWLLNADWFRAIFVGSDIWQEIGWGSIIYLAALTGIDSSLYEAAKIDGAGRWKQLIHITLPGLLPTIIILLILRMGFVMNVGFEKVILLYSPSTYEKADVISSFVYRKGIIEANYSYATAVGFFNSAVNFIFLLSANKLSKKYSESSLF
ncbi:ABC transporter permease subunit [Paenibacillus roseipurpureus]|uniref:ABC transporter permease subunit n=2 Tax=Paenibacillus roseopurpureus TaxID=2918901 RepID=A0AA96LRR7_9BACL|nr:ABC transporter permease subunit [Paenibacillus sp. MBLB1832]WNR47102.1 ABC transporter permease subunit [Paenibacillus sp. MBLB1832]